MPLASYVHNVFFSVYLMLLQSGILIFSSLISRCRFILASFINLGLFKAFSSHGFETTIENIFNGPYFLVNIIARFIDKGVVDFNVIISANHHIVMYQQVHDFLISSGKLTWKHYIDEFQQPVVAFVQNS